MITCTTFNQTTKTNNKNTSKKKKKTKTISSIKWEMPNRLAKEAEIQEICLRQCLLRRWQSMKRKMKELSKSRNMKRIKSNFKIFRRNNHKSFIRNVNSIVRSGSFLTLCRVKWALSLISCSCQIRTFLNRTLDFSTKEERFGIKNRNLKTT